MKLSKELEMKGKAVVFTESLGDEVYDQYSGMNFTVLDIFLDHKTSMEDGDCDPINLPMVKIQLTDNPNITFNAYCDEVGTHRVIDIFISGIQAAKPLRNSYNSLPGSTGYDASKVLSIEDYKRESESHNPYTQGSCEHWVFRKGFESMFYK